VFGENFFILGGVAKNPILIGFPISLSLYMQRRYEEEREVFITSG
jgi:hypothetical protein